MAVKGRASPIYNERRKAEELMLPLTFFSVVKDGFDDGVEEQKTMLELLGQAVIDIKPSILTEKQRVALIKRTHGIIRDCVTNPTDGSADPAAKVGLAMVYFINNMISQGAYYIADDSNFMKALDLFTPTVEPWLQVKRFDKSAFKYARNILKRLHAHGYMQDVSWVLEYQ